MIICWSSVTSVVDVLQMVSLFACVTSPVQLCPVTRSHDTPSDRYQPLCVAFSAEHSAPHVSRQRTERLSSLV